jgi:putative membrane protein
MNLTRLFTIPVSTLGLCLCMAACGGNGSDTATTDTTATHDTMATAPMPADTASSTTMTDANILAALSQSDSMEVEEGKVARSKAKNADVKAFGKMMIDDHTAMMKDGAALAKQLNIVPAPMAGDTDLSAAVAELDMLKKTDAASFDKAYIDHAVMDHQKVLDKLSMMESQAQSDSVKSLIQRARPKVQMHLDRAKEIQGKIGSASM